MWHLGLLVALVIGTSNDLGGIADDQLLLHKFADMLTHASTFAGWEVAAFVVREPDGNLQCVLWPTSGQYEAQAFRGVVPDNVVAIVHTHPPRMDPRPSPGDIKAAQRLGLAIYVLTRHGIYAADPSGAVVPVIERPDWITAAMRGPRCACKPTEHPR
ncbi:MAG: hypothetical protein DMF58_09455 [Acidobacteria bacterium]|nr:MAG: hypothetical protein DMF58_09455 [Acidobacteriota bacterium]